MSLPNPPFFEHYLFEAPGTLATMFALVGLVLFIQGTRRLNRRVVIAAGVSVALAGGVVLLAFWITTTREMLIAQTREMIAATAPLDLSRLRRYVAPGAQLLGPDGSPWLSSDEIFNELASATQRFSIVAQDARRLQAETSTPNIGRTSAHIRTTFGGQSSSSPVVTDWIFTWEMQPDGLWRITQFQWMLLQGSPPPIGIWR